MLWESKGGRRDADHITHRVPTVNEKYRPNTVLTYIPRGMKGFLYFFTYRVTGVFGILRQLKSITAEEILKRTPNIVSSYQEDLEESLGDELMQFTELLKTNVAAAINNGKHEALELQFYKLIMENSLESCFPNVEIVLRIYLSLMNTNCSIERSFSTLQRTKSELRNMMGQDRLNNLT